MLKNLWFYENRSNPPFEKANFYPLNAQHPIHLVSYPALIDGHWTEGDDTISVTNPADGKKIADVSLASKNQAIIAIEGASRAFESWSQTITYYSWCHSKKNCDPSSSDQKGLLDYLPQSRGSPCSGTGRGCIRCQLNGLVKKQEGFQVGSPPILKPIANFMCYVSLWELPE